MESNKGFLRGSSKGQLFTLVAITIVEPLDRGIGNTSTSHGVKSFNLLSSYQAPWENPSYQLYFMGDYCKVRKRMITKPLACSSQFTVACVHVQYLGGFNPLKSNTPLTQTGMCERECIFQTI